MAANDSSSESPVNQQHEKIANFSCHMKYAHAGGIKISQNVHKNTISINTNSAQTQQYEEPPYNWQATRNTLQERFSFLLNKSTLSDIAFVVGRETDKQRISAHKFILSCGSAVFDALFNGPLATTSIEVELPDVEPAAFLNLLRFLYTDEKVVNCENVITTLYTAKKYAVPALENFCVDFLKDNLCPQNAVTLLTQARLFDEIELGELCLETIDRHAEEAMHTDAFLDIDHNTLCSIIERNSLLVLEVDLLEAVVQWSCAECKRQGIQPTPENQRKVLGRALYLIRFPLMTIEHFAVSAVQSGLLTETEAVQMFLYFVVTPKPPIKFSDKPRCYLMGKEALTLRRFEKTESRWGYSGTSDRVRLVVDRRIYVLGFGLYGAIRNPANYEVDIQIINSTTGRVCGSNRLDMSCEGNKTVHPAVFKDPVELQANTSYILAATLKGPDSYYGTLGKKRVTFDIPQAGRVTFHFSYAAGNNNGTSVEDGQIPEILFHI